jgi:predicted lactoylglutathione lyase
MFGVFKLFDGQMATVGNGTMIALAASNPEQVQTLNAKALALGSADEDAPGPRGDGFNSDYFRDLDGNKLAAFACRNERSSCCEVLIEHCAQDSFL